MNNTTPAPDGPLAGKTPEQIDAVFDRVFKDLVPPKRVTLTPAQRLKPFRDRIMKYRRAGCAWKTIARGLGDKDIGVKVSAVTLKALFGTRQEKDEIRDRKAKRMSQGNGSGAAETAPKANRASGG